MSISTNTADVCNTGGTEVVALGWRYSSAAGSATLASRPGASTVTVTVENNVGQVANPYHNASLVINGQSFAIERESQGATYTFTATLGADGSVVIDSTDGWSSNITLSFATCAPAQTTVAPAASTTPAPVVSAATTIAPESATTATAPASAVTTAAPTEASTGDPASTTAASTTVATSHSLPRTGISAEATDAVMSIGSIALLVGALAALATRRRPA